MNEVRGAREGDVGAVTPWNLMQDLVGLAFETLSGMPPMVVIDLSGVPPRPDGTSLDLETLTRWRLVSAGSTVEMQAVARAQLNDGHPVLLMPPWGQRDTSWADPDARGELKDGRAVTLVPSGSVPTGPNDVLGTLLPPRFLASGGFQKARQLMARSWQPVVVIAGSGSNPLMGHFLAASAVVLWRPRLTGEWLPLRMFQIPHGVNSEDVRADFEHLMKRSGGRGRFGYVLREPIPAGDSLAFDRHDPDVKARRTDLSSFGSAVPLAKLFDLVKPAIHSSADGDKICDENEPGAVRLLSGEDIVRGGTLAISESNPRWALVPPEGQLRAGDLVIPKIHRPSGTGGLTVAEVAEADLPLATGKSVLTFRPSRALSREQRLLALIFLRSPLARTFLAAEGSEGMLVLSKALGEILIPQPDAVLSAALADLADAAERLEEWKDDASALLNSVFLDDVASVARARLIDSGRNLRLRVEAASRLDDFGHVVRTRFPHPVAYRWRTLEAEVSAGATRGAYTSILDAAEVLIAYSALASMALARETGIQIGAVEAVRAKLVGKRSGPGFGDWVAVLREVAESKRFRGLPDNHPLTGFRSMLSDRDVDGSLQRLADRRNDESHQRKVDSADIPAAIDEAFADLKVLAAGSRFLADLPLIEISSVRWDSIQQTAEVNYRELMGDHPVVPTRVMSYSVNDLELGSLYILGDLGRPYLLRPFLIGKDCPACRNWSTFHVDRSGAEGVTLKSLEHGHTLTDGGLVETMEGVGLL